MADQMTRNNSQLLLMFHRLLGSFSEEYFYAALINIKICISNFFQGDQNPAAIFPHAAFAFTIAVILGFLQVKYQGKDKTPFESHPMTSSIAVTSLLIYCLAYGIEQRLSSCRSYRIPSWASNTVRCCMLLSGSLSLAATASFLFPDSVRPVIFAFYFISSACEMLRWVYQRESNWGWRRCRGFFKKTWRFLGGDCIPEQRQRLPL